MPEKVYIDVHARFKENGSIIPFAIIWTNDKKYKIDRVTDIRKIKVNNKFVLRYTCKMGNSNKYLWKDDNYWYVEVE